MKPLHQLPVRWLTSLAAALLMAPVLAAEPAVSAPAQTYQKDRAACLQGLSQQDRATCLKEAGAALAEAPRGRLGAGEDARTLTNNALQRCKSVPPKDRSACERMALGEGKVFGVGREWRGAQGNHDLQRRARRLGNSSHATSPALTWRKSPGLVDPGRADNQTFKESLPC